MYLRDAVQCYVDQTTSIDSNGRGRTAPLADIGRRAGSVMQRLINIPIGKFIYA